MQPFPTYQNFGYQPQYGGYQQYNPLQPQYDRLAQMQTQYNQQQLYNQPVQQAQTPGLNGEIVDGLDVVKAKNVDMSGQPTFYPKSDLSEVYVKRLMADGTSQIITYKAVQPEDEKQKEDQSYVDIQMHNSMLGQVKAEILQGIGGELSEIKQMITPIESPKVQRGGNQK